MGSRWYRAPEMLAGSTDYGTAVDVWACACLATEMSSGRPLFPGEDEGELVSIFRVGGKQRRSPKEPLLQRRANWMEGGGGQGVSCWPLVVW